MDDGYWAKMASEWARRPARPSSFDRPPASSAPFAPPLPTGVSLAMPPPLGAMPLLPPMDILSGWPRSSLTAAPSGTSESWSLPSPSNVFPPRFMPPPPGWLSMLPRLPAGNDTSLNERPPLSPGGFPAFPPAFPSFLPATGSSPHGISTDSSFANMRTGSPSTMGSSTLPTPPITSFGKISPGFSGGALEDATLSVSNPFRSENMPPRPIPSLSPQPLPGESSSLRGNFPSPPFPPPFTASSDAKSTYVHPPFPLPVSSFATTHGLSPFPMSSSPSAASVMGAPPPSTSTNRMPLLPIDSFSSATSTLPFPSPTASLPSIRLPFDTSPNLMTGGSVYTPSQGTLPTEERGPLYSPVNPSPSSGRPLPLSSTFHPPFDASAPFQDDSNLLRFQKGSSPLLPALFPRGGGTFPMNFPPSRPGIPPPLSPLAFPPPGVLRGSPPLEISPPQKVLPQWLREAAKAVEKKDLDPMPLEVEVEEEGKDALLTPLSEEGAPTESYETISYEEGAPSLEMQIKKAVTNVLLSVTDRIFQDVAREAISVARRKYIAESKSKGQEKGGAFVLKLHKATPSSTLPSSSEMPIEEPPPPSSSSLSKENQPLISAMRGYWDSEEDTASTSLSTSEKENVAREEAAAKAEPSTEISLSINGKISSPNEIKDFINLEVLSTGLFKAPETVCDPPKDRYTLYIFENGKRVTAVKLSMASLLIGSTFKYANIVDLHPSVNSQHAALLYIPKSFYLLPLGGQTRLFRNRDVPFVAKLMASLHPLHFNVHETATAKLSFEPSEFSENFSTLEAGEEGGGAGEEGGRRDATAVSRSPLRASRLASEGVSPPPASPSVWKPSHEEGILLGGGDKRVALTDEHSCFLLGESSRVYFIDLMDSTSTKPMERRKTPKDTAKTEKRVASNTATVSNVLPSLSSHRRNAEIPPKEQRGVSRKERELRASSSSSPLKKSQERGRPPSPLRGSHTGTRHKVERMEKNNGLSERSKERRILSKREESPFSSEETKKPATSSLSTKERYSHRHSKYAQNSNYASPASREEGNGEDVSPSHKKIRTNDSTRDGKPSSSSHNNTTRSISPDEYRHRRRLPPLKENLTMHSSREKETPAYSKGSSSLHTHGSSRPTRTRESPPVASNEKHPPRDKELTHDRRMDKRRPSSLSPSRASHPRLDPQRSKENRRREKHEEEENAYAASSRRRQR